MDSEELPGKGKDKSHLNGKVEGNHSDFLTRNSSLKKSPGRGEDYGVIWIPVGAIVAGVAGAVGVAGVAAAAGLVLAGGAAVTTGVVLHTINANNGGGVGQFVDTMGFIHQCDEVCNPKCLADASHAGKSIIINSSGIAL